MDANAWAGYTVPSPIKITIVQVFFSMEIKKNLWKNPSFPLESLLLSCTLNIISSMRNIFLRDGIMWTIEIRIG